MRAEKASTEAPDRIRYEFMVLELRKCDGPSGAEAKRDDTEPPAIRTAGEVDSMPSRSLTV